MEIAFSDFPHFYELCVYDLEYGIQIGHQILDASDPGHAMTRLWVS